MGLYADFDGSHATPDLVRFSDSYFGAKSAKDLERFLDHFSQQNIVYVDATLGWPTTAFEDMRTALTQFMPMWGEGTSYALRVLGDESSGIAVVVDTPELFGGEIICLAVFDIRDGKVVRWVDYWDGRHFGAEAFVKMRTPDEEFPATFGEETVTPIAGRVITEVSDNLIAALSSGDLDAVADLFAYDGVLEDLTLRTAISGPKAIRRYLGRVAADLPYGKGVSLRHIVGSDSGGGVEWINVSSPAQSGAIAIALDGNHKILRATAVWDGTRLTDETIVRLAGGAIDV